MSKNNKLSLVTTFPEEECPPSWTQYYIGKKHAFVIPALSSSVHESDSLNAFVSGSEE